GHHVEKAGYQSGNVICAVRGGRDYQGYENGVDRSRYVDGKVKPIMRLGQLAASPQTGPVRRVQDPGAATFDQDGGRQQRDDRAYLPGRYDPNSQAVMQHDCG